MVRIRVCRMWESVNTKRNGELISLDMIFIDEKQSLIHATIRKNQVSRYNHILSEGSIFVIKNFKVIEAMGEYRPVMSSLKIIFLKTTSLKKLKEDIVKIPINGFQFVKPEMLDARVNNNTMLSDVVGCLCGIGDIESVGSKWKKRDIQVFTDYSVTAKITLWENFGEKFDPYLYNKESGPYIVIVTSTTIKEFRGEISFATTSASKIYVNLDIDYITSLRGKFATTSEGIGTLESSNIKSIPAEEEMFLNRMTIVELLESDWSSEIQECIVTVRGKITEIDNYFGWYYISCNSCPRKVIPINGVYKCDSCAKECKFPLVKYKIHIKVRDDSKDTTFVLFNSVAEKLLDTSAHKLLNRLLPDSNDVPLQIQSLRKKDFVFKLKLNSYNLIEGLENFTVSKVFIPDEKLESQYKLMKDKKGKSKVEGNEPKAAKTVSVVVKSTKKRNLISGALLENNQDDVDMSEENLEDSGEDEIVHDDVKCRKRRNVIIDDEDFIDEDIDGCEK